MDDRRVNQQPASAYRRSVDQALERLCRVGLETFLEMSPGMATGKALARCEAVNVSPEDFAEEFRKVHHLRRGDEPGAEQFNLRRAALHAFAVGGRRWTMSPEGYATMDTASGPLRLDVIERDGRVGFGVRPVGTHEHEARVRLDIGDAVGEWVMRVRKGTAPVPVADEPAAPRLG